MVLALRPGGTSIIATFAVDGPASCGGLRVARYSPETLTAAIGPAFQRVRGFGGIHVTPAGVEQRRTFALFCLSNSHPRTPGRECPRAPHA